jgi:hypothetical protein
MKKHQILITLFTAIVFTACEAPVEWDLQASGNRYVIVESFITNENIQHEVSLHFSVGELNEKPEPLSGATVNVYDGTQLFTFSESPETAGLYLCDERFIAVVNRMYYLQIDYAGNTYTAHTNVLPVADFQAVSYQKITEDSCRLTNIPPSFSPVENAMHEIRIDWSQLPGYADYPQDKTQILSYYYTLTSLDVPEFFPPESAEIYFPAGARITHRKYSLTPQHAAFIRSMLLETQWRGGFFDSEHGNIETNLSEGALGFFGGGSLIEKQILTE